MRIIENPSYCLWPFGNRSIDFVKIDINLNYEEMASSIYRSKILLF